MTTDFKTGEVTAQSTAEAGGTVATTPAASSWRELWRRFAENRLALFGLLLIAILLLTATFAPLLAPYDPYDQDLANTLAPPSSPHAHRNTLLESAASGLHSPPSARRTGLPVLSPVSLSGLTTCY